MSEGDNATNGIWIRGLVTTKKESNTQLKLRIAQTSFENAITESNSVKQQLKEMCNGEATMSNKIKQLEQKLSKKPASSGERDCVALMDNKHKQ